MTKALHTRMIVSPSGPIHIGHVALALLNKLAADATGGTFIYGTRQFTCDLHPGKRDWPAKWGEANLKELCEVIPPTPAETLAAQGFDPTIGVFYGADVEDVEEAYRVWVDCHFDAAWGPWPPDTHPDDLHNVIGLDGLVEKWNKPALMMGQYEQGAPHPFITLMRVMVEWQTGRNCLIRGADRVVERDLYNAIAFRVRPLYDWVWQYFMPNIRRSGERIPKETQDQLSLSNEHNRWNPVRLSSSMEAVTAGFYLHDVKAAGRTPEELIAFLRWAMRPKDIWTDEFETGWVWDEQGPYVLRAIAHLSNNIVIPDEKWFRFLERGWGGPF